ncbi:hypothetical protein BTR14_03130 [Rhizobium rhizosphaerae]|uniref:Mannosyl-glycoprotein endo-beta-N-acetylglucosamidase-like domain-containing protein n=1 Tax=Xaviernesmea rhizosphaerae TaxID=1672749 RepID=A0ABX3PHG0_9HYPH|nr:glycoside hydrolase family 73 protein [Xaviernesmea rhizosphaerae]OQP87577.1 hypothetical protein BTR14_03130 [Xaviernesmea rhizosphaerae]
MVGFIFGGTTGLTYDQLQRRRQIEQDFAARLLGEKPKTALEGVAALIGGIGNGIKSWQTEKALKAGTDEARTGGWDAIQKAIMTGQPIDLGSSPSPASPVPAANIPQPGAASEISGTQPGNAPPPVDISGDRSTFVNALLPAAIEQGKRTGVDPRIIVAQAAQETGWGKSAPGNNFFGIKSHGQDGGNSLMTTEYVNGQPVKQRDSFRAYNSPEDSVRGYGDFITSNPRYKPFREAQGLDAQLEALQASNYATDPNYSRSVGAIARGIKLPNEVASLDGGAGMGGQPKTAAQAIEAQAPQQMPAMQPPRNVGPAPGANTPQQVAQSAPQQQGDVNGEVNAKLLEYYVKPFTPPEIRQAIGMLLQQRMQAAQAAQEEQRWRSRQDYETQQKRADPAYQLEQDYRRAQIDALHGKKEKNWQKLDEGTLFDPETGETKSVGRQGAPAGGFRYAGNSVEAQSLNGLMDSGTLTAAQAQQLGAGKTITGPNGEIIFMTPQGVFSQPQQGGQPTPFAPPAAVPNGSTAPGAPSSSGMPSPADGATAAPTQPGMIPLTGPKPQNTQISAEMGARIGMGDAFLKELPNIRQQIKNGAASGPIDGAMLGLGIGTPAAIWRNIETGRDALVRNLTGAGMSESEAKNQTARYQISPTDSQETMLSKLDNLERDLLATRDGAIKARTGNLGEAPKAEADPLASAREAIAKGAPREAIIQRLRENGINPEGL